MTDPAPTPFVIPDRVSWLKVWIDGALFPAFPDDRETNLGTMEGKFTLGDFTKDSERTLSSLIVGDLTGGSLADRVRGTTAQRYEDGEIEATFPNKITLPLIVDTFESPVAMLPGQTFIPTGRLGDTFFGCFGTELCAHSGDLYGEGSYASVDTLNTAPTNIGTIFDGKMYIPTGDGYHHWNGITLSAHLTGALAIDFAAFDNQLWVLTADRKVGFSTNGTTWTFPAGLVFKDEIPRRITPYVNTAGDPALIVNTEQAIWYVDTLTPVMRRTKAYWPPHPDFGKGAAVFPSGQHYYVTQGMGILRWDGETAIPGVGLDRDAGVPAFLRGFINDMLPEYNNLWILVQGQGTVFEQQFYFSEPRWRELSGTFPISAGRVSLWKFTGNGFHRQWTSDESETVATKMALDTTTGTYRLVWGANETAYHMDLRFGAYNPQDGLELGLDRFAPYGFFEIGRFYADTEGLQKLASHLMVDTKVASDTETITLAYESEENPGWNPLALIRSSNRHPVRYNVDPTYGFSRGTLSEWFRLRWEFRRETLVGGETLAERLAIERKSPLMDNTVFKFFKLPEPTTSHTLTIPIPAEPWNNRGPEEIRNHLDRLSGPVEFFPCVIGKRVYRGKMTQLIGSNFVGSGVQGMRQITVLDVPDGLVKDNQTLKGLIDAAAEAEAAVGLTP